MLMQKTRIRTYKQMTKREILADSLLLLTALIWGCAFAVVKNALDSFPPGAIIAMRYLIAAAITGILFRRHLKELTRGDVARGALVGLLLFGAYIVQTTGLQYTTAGKNAFLTTVYVLLVPFGCALLFHQKLQKSNLIAAVMMLVGIGLLSLDGQGGGLNPGDILTLICGFLFAGHIIAVEQCQKKTNTYALIVLQFAFCALYAGLYNRIFERGMPLAFTPGSIGGLLYIAVFSTTIGMSLQNIGQSMAPASHAVILLSLESVFGVLFSCLLLGEKVTLQMGVGFAIIFAALLVSDLDFIFSTDMLNLNKSQNEFFERVSQIIGVPKEDCVMFEDSLYAMQGARNAGLGVIGMTDATNTRDREAIRACCDRVIDSFDELP